MATYRDRLLAGDGLIGTWVKTPSHLVAEVLGMSDLDMVCLDAEHAPFGRLEMDQCIATLRNAGMPVLVRVPVAEPAQILNALDCGATGVLAPHICTKEQAEAFAKACRYGAGGRGYAGSTRAGGFTTRPMAKNLGVSRNETVVIAQIEDLEALDNLDEIAAVEGLDCLFIGRIDLTVAYGAETPNDPRVIAAVEQICAAGRKVGKPVGMFTPSMDEIPEWKAKGASLFLLDSDQGFLLKGAAALAVQFKEKFNS